MFLRLNRALIGAAILAAGVAGIWLGFYLATPTTSQPSPAASTIAKQGLLPTPASQPTQATAAAEPVGAALLAQYKAAPNDRAFIYQAMKAPELGGFTYSSYVLTICGQATAAPKGTVSEAQRAALASLRTRCDMSDSERKQMEDDLFRTLLKERDKDPIEKSARAILTAESPAERSAMLARAMEFQMPSPILLLASVPLEEGKGPYFQGKNYDMEHGKQLYLATNLAGCSLGVDCGANSTAALTLCATRNWCAADLPSALRAGHPDDYEQIEALSKQIVQAIERRDAAAFVSGV